MPKKHGGFRDAHGRGDLSRRNGAFTLIELLVVIAIIAILAAMLLPVLNRAEVKGQGAACLNNFKQLQLCYHMYVDDNNNYLPPNFSGDVDTWSNSWIVGNAQSDVNSGNIRKSLIFQYNQQAKIYVCPANTWLITVPTGGPYYNDAGQLLSAGQRVPQTRTCSLEYSMGGYDGDNAPNYEETTPAYVQQGYGGSLNSITYKTYQKFSSLQTTRIASKFVFADEAQNDLDDGTFRDCPLTSPMIYAFWNLPANRHGNAGVFSFADGHVETYKWLGAVVNTPQYQNTYGVGIPIGVDPSDGPSVNDLSRCDAGSAQYP